MFLHTSPRLVEAPYFPSEQIETTIRNIEEKKQKLEDDIAQYIREKQGELQKYEQQVLKETLPPLPSRASQKAQIQPVSNTVQTQKAMRPAEEREESELPTQGIEDVARPSKPTRVHKREKELMGLIAFLPLLDASETSPDKKKKKLRSKQKDGKAEVVDSQTSAESQVDSSTTNDESAADTPKRGELDRTMSNESQGSETGDSEKSSRRPANKKSSLRRQASKSRRKRVSIAIDDQIVHPSDNILASALISPPVSETADSSASSSTSSLKSPSDTHSPPQFAPPRYTEAVHHSLPLPLSSAVDSANQILANSPPPLEYESPPKPTKRTLPVSSPTKPLTPDQEADAIFASSAPVPTATYVGGIDGSGVDDLNQAGSYGYPSSLGASYLESYMASRPLSVRVAAGEKAELGEEEKRRLAKRGERDQDEDADVDVDVGRVEDVEGDTIEDVIGQMEDF